MIVTSLVISFLAIGISAYSVWINHLRPFRLLALNSKKISYMGNSEKDLLFDLYISFSNLGKKIGLIKNIKLNCKFDNIEINANVIDECKLTSEGTYKKDKDWHPILLRGEETKLAMFVFKADLEMDKIKDGVYLGKIEIEYQPKLKKDKNEVKEIPFRYEINIKNSKLRNVAYRRKINPSCQIDKDK